MRQLYWTTVFATCVALLLGCDDATGKDSRDTGTDEPGWTDTSGIIHSGTDPTSGWAHQPGNDHAEPGNDTAQTVPLPGTDEPVPSPDSDETNLPPVNTDGSCSVTEPGGTGDEPGGLIPACCAPTAAEKAVIDEVFRLLNEHRQQNGVPALRYDNELEAAIQGHCRHMEVHDFFDHMAPENVVSSPWDRAELCGTNASGENIAMGQQTAAEVMADWKSSPGHNANMLSADFSRVGIGFVNYTWGQLFD